MGSPRQEGKGSERASDEFFGDGEQGRLCRELGAGLCGNAVDAFEDSIECAGFLELQGSPGDIFGTGALAGAQEDFDEAGAVARRAAEVLHDERAYLALSDVGSPLAPTLVAIEVNNVVLQLKEHAELCEGGRKTSSIGSAPSDDERARNREREQRRSLAGDGLVVVVIVEALAAEHVELRRLAADGGLSIFGEGAGKRPTGGLGQPVGVERYEGEHEEQVAGVHSLGHTVHGPGSGVSATDGVAILKVVVDEAGIVEELAGCSPGDGGFDGEADSVAGPECEFGAEPLSARCEVLSDDGTEAIQAGPRGKPPDQALDRFERRSGWRRTVTRFDRGPGASGLWRGGVRHAIGP